MKVLVLVSHVFVKNNDSTMSHEYLTFLTLFRVLFEIMSTFKTRHLYKKSFLVVYFSKWQKSKLNKKSRLLFD